MEQHRVAAALARSIAELMEEKAWLINTGHLDSLAQTHGKDSLDLMDLLGDWLNGMDAADLDLASRTSAVFEKGRKLFRQGGPYAGDDDG